MKLSISLLLLALLLNSCVQQIKLVETAPVSPLLSSDYVISGVSPDNKSLLLTKPHYFGLYQFDLHSGKIDSITDLAGAGYKPAYSERGKYLIYRTDDYSEKIRLSSIYMYNLKNGKRKTLVENKRAVSVPYVFGNDIVYTVDGSLDCNNFYWWLATDPDDKTFVLSEDLEPELWVKGTKKRLKPLGDGQYIWISLSPDKKKMLFYVAGKGCYVSDLKGNILLDAGNLLNPSWLNKNMIVGVLAGSVTEKTTASDIVAVSLKTSEKVVLSKTPNVNERNPFPFANGKKIAYQTSSGGINVMRIYFK